MISDRHFSTVSKPGSTFSTLYSRVASYSVAVSMIYNSWAFGLYLALPDSGNEMFRISIIDTQSERRLVVEGTLVEPWVPELRRSWADAGNSLEGRKLVIDLTNATMIDAQGEVAIFDLMKEGAKFCCSDVFTKHVLKELAHKCHTRLRNILNRPGVNGGRYQEKEER